MERLADNCEPPLDALSEEDLAVRVQRGCEASYAELDRRVRPRLTQILSLRLGNRSDAEDVAQLSLMRAFENIARFDPSRRFSPWMFTIGLRLATDFQRRRRLQPTLLEASLLDAMGSATRPSEEAEADELRSDLWQTVRESLGHEQAAALWLFYGEQQSVKEIASELGRSAVSVRVMLYRARKKLLPHLSDYDAGTSLGEDDKEEQVSVFGELAVGTES